MGQRNNATAVTNAAPASAQSPASAQTGNGERSAKGKAAGPIWTIWLVSFGIILGLVVAIVRYASLPSAGHDMTGTNMTGTNMTGTNMTGTSTTPMSEKWVRLRGDDTLGGLLSHRLLTVWQLDTVAIIAVVLAAAWYLTRLTQARRNGARWPLSRLAAFMAALVVCILATCGSIGVYDMALFSAHMIGHLAFVMVVPALLMAGRPLELALLARTGARRERLARRYVGPVASVLTAPPVALAAYAVVIVGSHLTGLMDVIMRNSWAGQLEHLVYIVIGCQFMVLVLGDAPIRWQLSTPARWLLLAISMAVDTFVGVIIMQASLPVGMLKVPGFVVNPHSDTITGGAIMWFGGDGIMAAIMILLVLGWLRDPERQRQDNRGWLEQARRATFAERTGAQGMSADLDFDSEDARLRTYNEWLASLDSGKNGDANPAVKLRRR